MKQQIVLWGILVLSALLEVSGDAAIRSGLRGNRSWLLVGPVLLVGYGFVVNLSRIDFARLLGLYIVFFFVVSQALAVLWFHERLSPAHWCAGALIVSGGLVLNFSAR